MLDRRLAILSAAALAAPIVLPVRGWAQGAPSIGVVAERAGDFDQTRALVVLRDGVTVFERAFRGPGLDAPANVKSVSKTLVALLTGIAIERGHLSGPDARVLPILGRPPVGDARDGLTVDHLLSMRAGFESTSGPRYGAWVESRDWVGYVLGSDLVDRPGGRYIYSTGSWHVLGAVLAEATGRSLHDLANAWLGEPLGVRFARWDRDPQGYYLGGNQMALTPRALARVGEMARSGGRWNGRQVVPQAWIDTSWRSRGRSRWTGDGYGYGWFLTRLAGRRAAYGRGYGGQVLAVVPELGLTMAITSDPTRPARSRGHFGDLARLMQDMARAAVSET